MRGWRSATYELSRLCTVRRDDCIAITRRMEIFFSKIKDFSLCLKFWFFINVGRLTLQISEKLLKFSWIRKLSLNSQLISVTTKDNINSLSALMCDKMTKGLAQRWSNSLSFFRQPQNRTDVFLQAPINITKVDRLTKLKSRKSWRWVNCACDFSFHAHRNTSAKEDSKRYDYNSILINSSKKKGF